jgi:hypothetical protein
MLLVEKEGEERRSERELNKKRTVVLCVCRL